MAPRCSPGSPLFLPFLYPSLYFTKATSPIITISNTCRASLNPRLVRHHVTETLPKSPSPPTHTEPNERLNPAPDEYYQSNFADKARIQLVAGDGGSGAISFLRAAFVAEGPPNGGDGGSGGNIYIEATHSETSLHKLARRRVHRAGRGTNGRGSSQGGQRGEDVVIQVPVGTVVKEISREDPVAEEALMRALMRRKQRASTEEDAQEAKDRAEQRRQQWESMGKYRGPPPSDDEVINLDADKWVLYPGMPSYEAQSLALPRLPQRDRVFAQPPAPIHLDLSRPTEKPILLATGGMGGLGNPHFASREMPRPVIATKGEKAVSLDLELELKLLADVGLVGLPNAGKSTLVRSLTNSRARVGDWAFTTLQPNIGTVVLDNNRGRPQVMSHFRSKKDDLATFPQMSSDGIMRVPPSSSSDNNDNPDAISYRTRFTIADIPGLVPDAHLDKGLGIEFLRHVERAGVLAFVIDLSAGSAVDALKALWNEVGLYAQMRDADEQAAKGESLRQQREKREEEARNVGEGLGSRERYFARKRAAAAAAAAAGGGADSPNGIGEYAPEPDDRGGGGLHIAGKPWFVVATKADLPETQENFAELRAYLARVTRGEEAHPSGIEGAWKENVAAIVVSAIHGHGVERIVHWTVGLLDQ